MWGNLVLFFYNRITNFRRLIFSFILIRSKIRIEKIETSTDHWKHSVSRVTCFWKKEWRKAWERLPLCPGNRTYTNKRPLNAEYYPLTWGRTSASLSSLKMNKSANSFILFALRKNYFLLFFLFFNQERFPTLNKFWSSLVACRLAQSFATSSTLSRVENTHVTSLTNNIVAKQKKS